MFNRIKIHVHVINTYIFWAETRHYWCSELVWVWVINLKWYTCTDVLTLVWHSPPCWRTHWTNHITRRGPCLSVQDIPSGLPADKTSGRHSSHLVQRKGKSASIQNSAGGSAGVHHSLFSSSTSISVVERTGHISSHFIHAYANCLMMGLEKMVVIRQPMYFYRRALHFSLKLALFKVRYKYIGLITFCYSSEKKYIYIEFYKYKI